jgi:hypothetical protein
MALCLVPEILDSVDVIVLGGKQDGVVDAEVIGLVPVLRWSPER